MDNGLLQYFSQREARVLRLVHSEFLEAVTEASWKHLGCVVGLKKRPVREALVHWRASMPRAIAIDLRARLPSQNPVHPAPSLAPLRGGYQVIVPRAAGAQAAPLLQPPVIRATNLRDELIDADVGKFLRGIRTLDISNCAHLSDAAFVHLRGIRHLRMRSCKQTSITNAAFSNLRGIERLDMEDCDQATITGNAFLQLRGIRHLNVGASRHPLCAALRDRDTLVLNSLLFEEPVAQLWLQATSVGLTPLCVAASMGFDEMVWKLLNMGAYDVDGEDLPLHVAIASNRGSIALKLLSWGADINQRNGDGKTPLCCAQERGFNALAKALIERGARGGVGVGGLG